MSANIEGTIFNADSLLLLEHIPSAYVNLIYLDPPWPTMQEDIGDYFSFFANIVHHANRILRETGNLFVHVAPFMAGRTSMLIEHIVKGAVFRDQFIIPVKSLRHHQFYRTNSTYTTMLLYGKSKDSPYNKVIRNPNSVISQGYSKQDNRGMYRRKSLFQQIKSVKQSGLQYEWNGVKPAKGQVWLYSRERLEELAQSGLVEVGPSGNPYLKVYLDNYAEEIGSIWDDITGTPTAKERTGYSSQQGEELIERVLEIGSLEDDLVLDPFCGSGTTLVMAEKLRRRWIGCDISETACSIAHNRVYEGNQAGKVSFVQLDSRVKLARFFGKSYSVSFASPEVQLWGVFKPEAQPKEKDTIRPIIFTEGKTDWKHLKIALTKLIDMGLLEKDFALDFFENESKDVGDAELLRKCKLYAETPQLRKCIFVFDRDDDEYVRQVCEQEKSFRNWGNNVYSMAIPVPAHRNSTPKVSIEFYYREEDLKRKNNAGRRLFLSNEFNPLSGRHVDEDLNCLDPNRIKGAAKVVDNKVFDSLHNNVALTKSDFADHIYFGTEGFDKTDFVEFMAIFKVINEIIWT